MKTLPLGSGEIVDVTITGYEKGERGCPGELFGTFVSGLASGSIIVNCEQGVFGKMTYSSRADAIPIAFKSEVKQGPAKILTTISGNKPQEFDIEIEKLTISSACKTKNIVIKVTDPRLLEATGGIVQGMSGSPIIQDGKLVGAVTHVFVSDPTRGYGIFIENMMEAGSGGMDKAA
jgi:stage IV sporulation protein B